MAELLKYDVTERAQLALSNSPIYALRDLRVAREGEQLLIFGRVSSFYQKQLAQEAVRAVVNGTPLHNQIDVSAISDDDSDD